MSAGYLAKCSSRGRPKQRHATQEAAEQHRINLVRIGRYTMKGSNTYHCNVCGFWHTGGAKGTKFRGQGKGKGKR